VVYALFSLYWKMGLILVKFKKTINLYKRRTKMSDGTKTTANLQAAFAGESQANRKYLAFARQAETEGFPQVARLFRAAAEAETIHAHNHLRALKGIGSTRENLMEAIAGETHEFKSMYPAMIADAKAEGETMALRSFVYANGVEKVHAGLYEAALAGLETGLTEVDYYICPECGHTVAGKPPLSCEFCGVAGSEFFRVV
jgi:rubrerythrin